MVRASIAETTAAGSTSQNSAILRLMAASIGRSLRHTMKSGWIPMLRSSFTECCVGLVLSSEDAAM